MLLLTCPSLFNSQLTAFRRTITNGVYDIHTNTMQYPAMMQPTRARIEQIVDDESADDEPSSSTVFPPLNPAISRNFLVMDTHMEAPPTGVAPTSYDVPLRPAPAQVSYVATDIRTPFQGLSAVPQEIRDLLPDECRLAFDKALKPEEEWLSKWGPESISTSRREPVVDKAIVPYSMIVF